MKLNPSFVKTRNVRNFEVLMDTLALAEGEGRFGLIYGQAGRGKTRTSQWYAAQQGSVYMRVLAIWNTSERDFLRALATELGVLTPPWTKSAAFKVVLDKLVASPRPIILDEMEKMPPKFLGFIRDLTDLSGSPVIFVGEVDLLDYLRAERRVWSRVFQAVEFEPISASDIVFYGAEVAGLRFDKAAAALAAKDSGGDFRLVRRLVVSLAQMAKGKGASEVNAEMVSIAAKQSLSGR